VAQIIQNLDLAPTQQGIETCAVASGDVALYTGNWFAAYSIDSGHTFRTLNPKDMMRQVGYTFCCDQRVEYMPSISTFVWELLSMEGPLMLAVASPDQITSSHGLRWTRYVVTPAMLGFENTTFDFPQLSFGTRYLYLTANLIPDGEGTSTAFIMRLPLNAIQERATIPAQFVQTPEWMVCPCHNTKGVGWFATLNSDSLIRVYSWEEPANAPVSWFDVNIATVPSTNFDSDSPDGDGWLQATSKIQSNITGAARSDENLFLAWSAGKTYSNGVPSLIPQSHIELANIDLGMKSLKEQRYIWNPNYAFAWPSLAANWGSPPAIGISFAWGGGLSNYPQYGVGTVYPRQHLLSPPSGLTIGSGGHYNDIRMNFPNTDQFVATGFVQTKDRSVPPNVMNRPHYMILAP
jgi:hypothetical protein